MLTLQLPETSAKLVVKDGTEMYLRAVEVLIGGIRFQLHECESRRLPLMDGEIVDDMERVNLLRLSGAVSYIDRCRKETIHTSPIRQIKLHLSPERNGWHTMFEVRILAGTAEIHVCNPSWPVNNLHKLLEIQA